MQIANTIASTFADITFVLNIEFEQEEHAILII